MTIYGIYYHNGYKWDDSWSGLLDEFYTTVEKAEQRIVELQTKYEFEQANPDTMQWYDTVPTWKVQPIEVK